MHAFICPIRNDDGSVCTGVEIRDCGYKVGLNGVDNGAIAFHGVRIPRENLLDRFAQVRSYAACHSVLAPGTEMQESVLPARKHPHRTRAAELAQCSRQSVTLHV